ncbi:hypothetical protein [Microvirga roseola]|uniref:hypothetical protein n=1 Tax=Microvirga roseola TaxID=2883126 RepID=UPI001E5D24A5|nr:hypothetical protein [Microvirga roseola]
MTRDQLAENLDHLDPGASLSVDEDDLARMFGTETLSYADQDILKAISAFALDHRCTFSYHQAEGGIPCFQKDDVF